MHNADNQNSGSGPQPRSTKALTIRVQGIPPEVTKCILKQQLSSRAPANAILDEKKLTIVRLNNDDEAVATATFHTELAASELVERLRAADDDYAYDSDFTGLTPLFDHPESKIDLVAVPGLASHAIGAWKHSETNNVWLRDFLPRHTNDLRVLVYGYQSTLANNISEQSIASLSQIFLETVRQHRKTQIGNEKRRPIVFVGHGLGGLIVKEALYQEYDQVSADFVWDNDLCDSCCGLLFFGVPHLGIKLEGLRSIVQGKPNEQLITEIAVRKTSEPSSFLRRMTSQFANAFHEKLEVISFYERHHSKIIELLPDGTIGASGRKDLLVTEDSARAAGLGVKAKEDAVPVETDHSGLVEYRDRFDPTYKLVMGRLDKLISNSRSWVPEKSFQRRHPQLLRVITELIEPESFGGTKDAKSKSLLEWLQKTPEFQDWARSKQSHLNPHFLHIRGKLGCGKTVLMKTLTDEFHRPKGRPPPVIIKFFFLDSRPQNSPTALCRGLLSQLYKKIGWLPMRTQQQLLEQARDWEQDPGFVTAKNALCHALSQCLDQGVFIFIDGMDICLSSAEAQPDVPRQIESLFNSLSSETQVRICASTRRNFDLGPYLRGTGYKLLTLDVSTHNTSDLNEFIRGRLEECQISHKGPGIDTSMLQAKMISRAGNSFLWAQAVTNIIHNIIMDNIPYYQKEDCPSRGFDSCPLGEYLLRIVDSCPLRLKQTFSRAIDCIPSYYHKEALFLFQLVSMAARPITVSELGLFIPCRAREAIDEVGIGFNIHRIETWLQSRTGDLLELRKPYVDDYARLDHEDQHVIQFIHPVVHDYCSKPTHLDKLDCAKVPSNHQYRAHLAISTACMQIFDLSTKSPETIASLDMHYASQFWALHTRKAFEDPQLEKTDAFHILDQCRPKEAGSLAARQYFCAVRERTSWRAYGQYAEGQNVPTWKFLQGIVASDSDPALLQLLAFEGCDKLVVRHISKCPCYTRKSNGNIPVVSQAFLLASQRGWATTAKLIKICASRRGVRLGVDEKYFDGRLSPLYKAAFCGDLELVAFLTAQGADVLQTVQQPYQTPFFAAVASRRKDVVELMLGLEGDVNERLRFQLKNSGWSVFHKASSSLNKDVTKNANWQPMVHILEILLLKAKHIPDVLNLLTDKGETALDLALRIDDNNQVVQLLRENGGKTGAQVRKDREKDEALRLSYEMLW